MLRQILFARKIVIQDWKLTWLAHWADKTALIHISIRLSNSVLFTSIPQNYKNIHIIPTHINESLTLVIRCVPISKPSFSWNRCEPVTSWYTSYWNSNHSHPFQASLSRPRLVRFETCTNTVAFVGTKWRAHWWTACSLKYSWKIWTKLTDIVCRPSE